MFIPMIDTLVANVNISDYEKSAIKLIEKLENKKEEAKIAATNIASQKILIKIGHLTFQVLPNGKQGYAYILHNDWYEVNLSQFRSKCEEFYPVHIRIKAECLWSLGPERAWDEICSWVQNNIGGVITSKISRIDLCCHTDELILTHEDIETFKGTFFNMNMYMYRRRVTGMNFGSGNSNKIYCRIYDKTQEVKQKGQKLWFFEIWKRAGSEAKNIWNIEFQINREFLKERNIETVENAFKALRAMWEYCTMEWIVKVDLVNTRIERCPTNSTWKTIQKVFEKYKHHPMVKRKEQLIADAQALVPGTFGNITSYAARKGITDLNLVLHTLKISGIDYLENKELNFEKVVTEKMSVIKVNTMIQNASV